MEEPYRRLRSLRAAAGDGRSSSASRARARRPSRARSTASRRARPARSWPVNMPAIPAALLESELFGHARGAFTGAERERRGLLEEAAGGNDLLRRDRRSRPRRSRPSSCARCRSARSGASARTAPRPIDVRVVSATSRDLARDVEAGRFREDLYYRLHVARHPAAAAARAGARRAAARAALPRALRPRVRPRAAVASRPRPRPRSRPTRGRATCASCRTRWPRRRRSASRTASSTLALLPEPVRAARPRRGARRRLPRPRGRAPPRPDRRRARPHRRQPQPRRARPGAVAAGAAVPDPGAEGAGRARKGVGRLGSAVATQPILRARDLAPRHRRARHGRPVVLAHRRRLPPLARGARAARGGARRGALRAPLGLRQDDARPRHRPRARRGRARDGGRRRAHQGRPRASRKAQGLLYALKPKNMGPEAHPNSVAIHLRGRTRSISILGASIGGGMIEIREVDGFPVVALGQGPVPAALLRGPPGRGDARLGDHRAARRQHRVDGGPAPRQGRAGLHAHRPRRAAAPGRRRRPEDDAGHPPRPRARSRGRRRPIT